MAVDMQLCALRQVPCCKRGDMACIKLKRDGNRSARTNIGINGTQLALTFLLLCLWVSETSGIGNAPLQYRIREELLRNTLVGNVASDSTLAREHGASVMEKLRFRFLTQPELDRTYFTIEEKTGIIRTTGRIDRDLICPQMVECYLKFDIGVSPVQYFTIIKVNLEIIDINDNPPKFPQTEMKFEISESTLPGTTFAVPAATDTDSSFNGIQDYKLDSSSKKFDLRITNMADGNTDLRLVLKHPLDREMVDYYQVQIIAYDGGVPSKSGSVMVDIEVQDANDNDPKFENSTYEVHVTENVPMGSAIARVRARDPDLGTNGEIVYKFSRHTQQELGNLFGINSQTGEVFVKGLLDFEKSNIYQLSLLAHDRGADSIPATSNMVVRVMDTNDNPPHISVNTLTPTGEAQVKENAKIGTFVAHITVEDIDSGNNGKFACSINHNKNFQLQKLSDTEYSIITTKVFDREKRSIYTVPLICKDKGEQPQTSVVNLSVNVMDENDHTPVFWPPRYSAILEENNPLEAYILKVNATDGDVGPNGKITFRLDSNAGELVKIEPNSGLITAAIIFDYERIQVFEFTVYAVDNGEPAKSSSATVQMTILDHDDEQPKFSQDNYSFGTYENEEPGQEVGRVAAVDADNPPYNSFFYTLDRYHSAVDTFEIDSETGTIYTKKKLDREGQPVYYLTVLADPGDDIMFTSTASVSIYVADKNDNEPVFDFPTVENNTVRISSKAPVGHTITRLKAHDIDTGANAKLTFGIVEGNSGNTFNVDPVTGAVSVNTDIGSYRLEQFYLKVVVEDNGDPRLADYEDLVIVISSEIAFPVMRSPYTLEGDNLVIVLAFGLATLFVVIIIIIAIIIIIRKRNREHGNGVVCDKEMQKMLPTATMMDGGEHKGPPPPNSYVTVKDIEHVKNHINKMDTSHSMSTDAALSHLNDEHRIIIREIPTPPVSTMIWYYGVNE